MKLAPVPVEHTPGPWRRSALGAALLMIGAAHAQAGTALPAAVLEQVRRDALAAAAKANPGARIEVELGALDTRLQLAPCARIEPRWNPGHKLWGRTRVALRCVQGATPWQVYLPLAVQVWAPAWVATADIPAQTVVKQHHLRRSEIDWAAAAPQRPADADDAPIGRSLAVPVAAGRPLLARDLAALQWFAAGDLVRITVKGGGFAVAGTGEALAPGWAGQSVRVRTESGRIVNGKAAGERRVELML